MAERSFARDETESAVVPTAGATLLETLDGLRGRRQSGYTLLLPKLSILRTDRQPFAPIAEDAYRESGAEAGVGYALAVVQHCRSKVDMQVFQGEHTNWYLFADDALYAWDHHQHHARCAVANDFRPAAGDAVAAERALTAWIVAHFPRSDVSGINAYRHGIAYLRAGRIDDADAMLSAGETNFDGSFKGAVRQDLPYRVKIAREKQREEMHERLKTAIADARDRKLKGLPPAEDATVAAVLTEADRERILRELLPVPVELTAEQREQMAQQADARDRENAARWAREQSTRLFVEVDGGWMLVDEYARRRGPKDGETWVTLEQMQAIKAERAGAGE